MLRVGVKTFSAFPLLSTFLYRLTRFKPTPERINLPQEELNTLEHWKDIKAFERQLAMTKDMPPFSFYDGPPFATGTPHYGHIAAGTIKDVVCRYASQTGHYVERRFGWDCHGLPVEYEIDKELKITDKRQILGMGIGKYNQACRGIVMRYSGQWEEVVQRFGRWIDFKNDYKTMDLGFMESVWHVFKQLHDKGLVYRGRKIMPYSNACSTVLSNFQVQQNYKEVNDPSLHLAFPLVKDPEVSLVAWTTTPWTLPSNLVLAVNPQFTYVKVRDVKRQQVLVLAQCRLGDFFLKDEKYQILETMQGKELEGLEYVPLYSFFEERRKDGCFKVQTASFVTDSDGTGVVHCAPGFGQDDYQLCVSRKLIEPDDPPVPLDQNGRFTPSMGHLAGLYIKDADELIARELKEQGRLLRKGTIKHNYPFCWRSETPLIYKAVSTWFIRVTAIKEDLVANNHKAYWVPRSIQEKKFDNWLKDAKDWCFSRNRFWGNPIPLWVSDDGEEVVCVGSVKELEELTGRRVSDLHRENIDGLTIESKQGKGQLRRIEEVFDCWFESGSMPFAQNHYPFSQSQEQFKKTFPADFIGEGIDQTRGWFYTLNVISTALKNSNPYKNLIVNGLVLTETGKKMSKRLKNYPDPMSVCEQLGADAVRLYLINSPLVKAENLNFSKEGVRGVVRDVFLPWYNAYRFLILGIQKWEEASKQDFVFQDDMTAMFPDFNVTDKWIQSSLQELILKVRRQMQAYRLYNVVPALLRFLHELTNWYLRLNRSRLKGEFGEKEWQVSLNVLFDVLLKLTVLMSPHVPFITEHIYQNLRLVIGGQSRLREDSVHHLMIAEVNERLLDGAAAEGMRDVMGIIETARKLRENKKVSLKQPISSLKVVSEDQQIFERLKPFMEYIIAETNIQTLEIETKVDKYLQLTALPNLPVLGPRFKGTKTLGPLRKAITALTSQEIKEFKQRGSMQLLDQDLTSEDILVQEKLIESNLEPYEVIGGEDVIIVLDVRQDEALRLRGLAREMVTRMQKLKKKAGITPTQQVIFFYQFVDSASTIARAMREEGEMIGKVIKKPIIDLQCDIGLRELASEVGSIEDEEYTLKLCEYGPVMDSQAVKDEFEASGSEVVKMLLDVPLEELRKVGSVEVHHEGEVKFLKQGVHYRWV